MLVRARDGSCLALAANIALGSSWVSCFIDLYRDLKSTSRPSCSASATIMNQNSLVVHQE